MKKMFAFCLITLICAGFSACNLDNPIMAKWWEEKEPDFYFVSSIIKDVPIVTYETIYETVIEKVFVYENLPPHIILQRLQIIAIEYILFSGDQPEYNGDAPPGGTSLTATERDRNDDIVNLMVDQLKKNPNYLIMLHGHANATSEKLDEASVADLIRISKERAEAVKKEINNRDGSISDSRISLNWYGAGKSLTVPSSQYAGLNRRVEMILFTIETP